jgi:leader peptidase (prepilin peptidase)/N-methyltransferase
MQLLGNMPPQLFVFFSMLLGLFIGSFLNVVIVRLPLILFKSWEQEALEFLTVRAPDKLESIPFANLKTSHTEPFNLAFPASHCPHCHHAIRYYDNIPVWSFLWLRGRCRDCQAPIHWRYPTVELLSALLSGWIAFHFGYTPQAFAALFLTWVLLAQTFIDLEHQLLMDHLTLPTLWLGLLLSLYPVFASPPECILGASLGYLLFWCLYWIFKGITGKEAMGYGDFKLLALLGAWLGWKALPTIVLLASIGGSVIGICMIVFCGRNKNEPFPFGPYLAIAGWVALNWNDRLVAWWLHLMS